MDIEILNPGFDLELAIAKTIENGYFFGDKALTDRAQQELQNEIDNLPLEVDDHTDKPINKDKPNEVKQKHELYYASYGATETPVANMVIDRLTSAVLTLKRFPELDDWRLTEISYQRYYNNDGFIGPHRDRASDRLLSPTFTIAGLAIIRTFEPLGWYRDYSNLRQTDEFLISCGGIMLLRASGLGTGKQTIYMKFFLR